MLGSEGAWRIKGCSLLTAVGHPPTLVSPSNPCTLFFTTLMLDLKATFILFSKLKKSGNNNIYRSHLKKRVLVQVQGGPELQPAGILKYSEELKQGTNTEIGLKNFFEIASNVTLS
jgi:hypothetical protein